MNKLYNSKERMSTASKRWLLLSGEFPGQDTIKSTIISKVSQLMNRRLPEIATFSGGMRNYIYD